MHEIHRVPIMCHVLWAYNDIGNNFLNLNMVSVLRYKVQNRKAKIASK